MKEQLAKIRSEALAAFAGAQDAAALDALRVQYLGKKGELTGVLKMMGKLSAEERPAMGQLANEVRAAIEARRGNSIDWDEWEREQRREQIRNMKMPAHRPPSPHIIGGAMATEVFYESETSYRKRLAKWYKRYGKGNHNSST